MTFKFTKPIWMYPWIWIKVGLLLSKRLCAICLIESPLEMVKNAYYFVLKALFVLKIFKFFATTFWSWRKNCLIKKIRLTSKFMTSPPGLQTIATRIGNQTMKFGQLIEYIRHIFLQKSFRKWGREASSRRLFIFRKNLIWVESEWSAA